MATLHAVGGTIDINMASVGTFDHAAQSVPSNASEYSWTTTSGNTIHAFSFDDDITFSADLLFGGTVHALQVVSSYVVGGLVGNLVSMASGNVENYWRPILLADTTILASKLADLVGVGDFVNVAVGENLTGGDDAFEGAAPPAGGGATNQTFHGDTFYVGGRLTGGDDLITMRSEGAITGDADLVSGWLDGGDDTIVVDRPATVTASSLILGDVFLISDLEQPLSPQVNGGNDEIVVLGLANGTISGDIANAIAENGTSTGGADLVDASANTFLTEIYGDVAFLSGGHTVRGGKDTLIGSTTASNYISGDAGDVFSSLLAGADTITGGEVDDRLFGDFTNVGEGGTVTINGSFTGDDKIYGQVGDDEIYGQVGDDILDGGMGDDFLDGGSQTAGAGDIAAFNTLNVAVSADLLTGFAFGQGANSLFGFESLRGSNKGNSLGGDGLANRIEGLDGNDTINGRGGNDTILGGKNNDAIKGGLGNDTINGGAGLDTMEGNGGADTFQYSQLGDSGTVAATRDLINGFTLGGGGDKIDVSAIDAMAGTAGNQAFAFIGNAAFSAEGQIRFDVIAGHTFIEINTTGLGGAEMGIDLAGALPGLTAASFVL